VIAVCSVNAVLVFKLWIVDLNIAQVHNEYGRQRHYMGTCHSDRDHRCDRRGMFTLGGIALKAFMSQLRMALCRCTDASYSGSAGQS
jgi:hypothetical protein